MRETWSRMVYRMILRLHPEGFRERFGGEMLWIFDGEARKGATAHVLCDGVLSLIRQRCKASGRLRQTVPGGVCVDSGPGAVRLAQGGIVASMLFSVFLLMMGQSVPSTVHTRWPGRLYCSAITLLAPPRMDALSRTPLHSARTSTKR